VSKGNPPFAPAVNDMFAVVVLVAVTTVITGVAGTLAAVSDTVPAALVPARLTANPLTV
jgi:hypothetical protein